MMIPSLSVLRQWGEGCVGACADLVYDAVKPSTGPKPSVASTLDPNIIAWLTCDTYEPPRVRNTARISALQAQKQQVDTKRQGVQRSYRTAQLLMGVSGLAASIGVALLSSPFTIPLGLIMFGGGALGALTYYPRMHEHYDAAEQLKLEATLLSGQIVEASL